jgi:hypothetical protein
LPGPAGPAGPIKICCIYEPKADATNVVYEGNESNNVFSIIC